MEFFRRTCVAVAIATLAAAVLLLIWAAASLWALLFAGLLLAVLLRSLASFVHDHTGLPHGWSLGIVVLGILGLAGGGAWLLAPAVIDQAGQLSQQLPRALETIQQRLAQYQAGRWLLENFPEGEALFPRVGSAFQRLTGLLSGAVGILISVLVVVFVGLYVAADPRLYASGVVAAVPFRHRRRALNLIRKVYATLKWWLLGKFLTMAVVGLLTGLGLWIVGMDLVVTLAIFTALMEFIPNFGPYIGAAPALLIAMLHGPEMVVSVLIVYLIVQTIEGYILTPLVQQKMVALPPALLIFMQVLLAVLIGPIGLIIATPATAAGLVVLRELYVKDTLGDPIGADHGARVKSGFG